MLEALYRAFWVDKQGVQLPEVYEPIIAATLGKELASRVIEKVNTKRVVYAPPLQNPFLFPFLDLSNLLRCRPEP